MWPIKGMDPVFQKEHKILPFQAEIGDNFQLGSQNSYEKLGNIMSCQVHMGELASWRSLGL